MVRTGLVAAVLSLAACNFYFADDDDDDDIGGHWDGAPSKVDAKWCSDSFRSSCNAVSQTGCCAGGKCALVLDDVDSGAGHVSCIEDGTAAIGEACTDPVVVGTSDNCSAGGECYNNVCHEVCSTVIQGCANDGWCVQFVDGNGNNSPTQICLFGCDALDQTSCAADNEACYFIVDRGACIVPSEESAAIGEPCMFVNACVPGGICIAAFGAGVCHTLCGNVVDMWTDVDGTLTTPSCCGGSGACASATINCQASDQFCGLIGDGMGGLASEVVGFCATDEYHSSEDGSSFVCDCTGDPICVSSTSAVAPVSSELSVPTWRIRQ